MEFFSLLFMPVQMMAAIFIPVPWLAVFPGIYFVNSYYTTKQPADMFAGVLWLLYCFYEVLNKYLWCTGECNIRPDLFFIYFFLILVTVVAVMTRAKK